jgi:AcrR family transcriptional regulator
MATPERAARLPAGIERAWGLRPLPRKGPKPGLDLDAIVGAAAGLAQTEGLSAVAMSRVASALGVSTMALYGYVEGKDELLALMVDHACGPPPEPATAADASWRGGLAQWATVLFDGYRRHPWAVRIPISAAPPTPNQVAWLEAGLRCLAATELSEQQRLSTVLLLSVFVRSEAALALDLAEARQHVAASPGSADYGQLIRQLIDPERFPGVWAAAATGAFEDDSGVEGEFRFGLDRILDGIAVLLARDGARSATQ